MNNLPQLLKEYGVSISEAAKLTGLSYLSVRRHVRGERAVSADSAIKYEKGLGINRAALRPDLFLVEASHDR